MAKKQKRKRREYEAFMDDIARPTVTVTHDPPTRNLDARNAIDESLAKISGVLGIITCYAREEDFEDVQNACWMIADEIERLEEKLGDLGL
jgi:hypothetical protein